MLKGKRRHDYLRRHVFWTLAIVGSSSSWAEEPPENQLRAANGSSILMKQAEHGQTVDSVSPNPQKPESFGVLGIVSEEMAEPVQVGGYDLPVLQGKVDLNPSAESHLMLVSDGWNARKSVDQKLPLLDQAPPRPSYADDRRSSADSSKVEKDVNAGSKSTLRILGPETATPILISPSLSSPVMTSPSDVRPPQNQVAEKPESSRPSPHSLYGPGPSTRPHSNLGPTTVGDSSASKPGLKTSPRKIDELLDDLAEQSPGAVSAPSPEHNEPILERDKPSMDRSVDAEELSPPREVVERREPSRANDVDLTEPGGNQGEGVATLPGRLQVRDLKPLNEAAIDPPSLTRGTPAEPISRREVPRDKESEQDHDSGKQSIGDEPSEVLVPTSKAGDRIGPNKELILSIGMEGVQSRVNSNTAKLRVSIERTLRYYWATPEDSKERTHWGMFHNLMIYDKDTLIIDGKRRFNAVAWMAGNNPCRNELLFEQDDRGINVRSGVGLQGHQAQLLAVFGLIDVPAAYPVYVGRKKYSVEDIIRREMQDCKTGNELTFTLIGLSHYIDSNSQWVNNEGQDWNFERLIKEELAQPVVGAACGGTHRLMGFAHALRRRRAEGRPVTGQWERADRYVKDFIAYTWQLQNRDGSMSTAWYEKSDDNGEMDRKIQTTGHMVEFLLTALPDDQLQSPQMLRSMSFLVNTLYEERGHEWPVGPKGHALRALAMYYRRVFDRPDPWRPVAVARNSGHTPR